MIRLSEIRPGGKLNGIIPNETVEVIAAVPFGEDAFDLVYRTVSGGLGQQMLYADNLDSVASSLEAIYQSLHRRRERLGKVLDEIDKHVYSAPSVKDFSDDDWDDLEDALEEEINEIEDNFVDEATAAQSRAELANEINRLTELEKLAHELRNSGVDRKWDEVSKTLQDNKLMYGPNGAREKIIIFTEHRDTLNYLAGKIANMLSGPETVVVIRGGMRREERKRIEESFRNDPKPLIAGNWNVCSMNAPSQDNLWVYSR